MKLAAVVILYHPEETVWANISTYIENVDVLYIFDNSPTNNAKKLIHEGKKIHYYWDGENEGIAKRLNSAIKICIQEGYDYLLTMDQDSSFELNDVCKYKSLIKNFALKNVGIFGVLHDKRQFIENGNAYLINELLITSGSILHLEIVRKIGYFNEDLFIDGVDTEYCLRIFENGFITVLFSSIILSHQLGNSKRKITPTLKIEERKTHLPLRMYYITRNYFFLRNKYKNQLQYLDFKIFLNELKNGIFYGNQKMKFVYYFIKGYFDFRKNKMGKLCQY